MDSCSYRKLQTGKKQSQSAVEGVGNIQERLSRYFVGGCLHNRFPTIMAQYSDKELFLKTTAVKSCWRAEHTHPLTETFSTEVKLSLENVTADFSWFLL